jgi:hypothetical protein
VLFKILAVKLSTLIWHISLPLQPSGPKPKVPGAQRSQRLPTTFALHWHAPPRELHSALTEPVGSHWQSEKKKHIWLLQLSKSHDTKIVVFSFER